MAVYQLTMLIPVPLVISRLQHLELLSMTEVME